MSAADGPGAEGFQTERSDVPPPEVERPEVQPPEQWAFPEPSRHRLANGVELLAYDVPGQYVVSVRTVLPVPLSVEPREVEGVATIMSRLLDEGTDQHTAEEFAELLERKGIALGASVSDGGLAVDLDVPKARLEEALDLLRQVLAEPVFPQQEVDRHLRTRLAEIEQERAVGAHRAAWELIATLFDDGDRASRPTGGTSTSVAAITREHLVDFHRQHVGPRGMTVVVAGDLQGLDTLGAVERTVGTWRNDAQVDEPAPRAATPAADAARVVVVDRPGAVQSDLVVGCPGPDRRAEGGWPAYPVLSFVVGGSPNARIDAVLREEKGYSYGIRSGFRPRRVGGLFLTSGSVRADSTVDAVRLLLEILDGAREGFTDQEVRAGVDFLGKTAPGRFATADTLADEAAMLALDGLGTQFTTDMLTAMRDLTPQDLQTAYRRWVDGRWTVVVVGDAASCADGLRELGIGAVTVVPT